MILCLIIRSSALRKLTTEFLWFAVDCLETAYFDLVTAGIHVTEFYQYLVKRFQGTPEIEGVFQLLRHKVPLTSLKWKEL